MSTYLLAQNPDATSVYYHKMEINFGSSVFDNVFYLQDRKISLSLGWMTQRAGDNALILYASNKTIQCQCV